MGVAFLVGHRLEHRLAHAHHRGSGRVGVAAIDSFAIFVLIGPWFSNLQYYSRFDVDDAAHKVIDVAEYVLIGCSAVFVPSPTMFWWGIVLTRLVSFSRYLEIAVFSEHENCRRYTRCLVGMELISFGLSFALVSPCGEVGAGSCARVAGRKCDPARVSRRFLFVKGVICPDSYRVHDTPHRRDYDDHAGGMCLVAIADISAGGFKQ